MMFFYSKCAILFFVFLFEEMRNLESGGTAMPSLPAIGFSTTDL
jgi:hypothetical protein